MKGDKKVYKQLLPDEEVKITKGIFKGITGYPEQIEMSNYTSDNLDSIIHIRVDNKNVIQVSFNDVEFLYDDYLVYKSEAETGKPVKIIGKFRIKNINLDKFLMDKYQEIINYSQRHEYCMSAIPFDKVEFKFNELSLTIDEIKKIIS
jgi:hypothetical protein